MTPRPPPAPTAADAPIEAAVTRVLQGDVDAFATIVERYERPLHRWLLLRAPPAIEVDEVLQRALVEAYLHLDAYRSGSSFAAWLWTIARRQLAAAIDHARRQRRLGPGEEQVWAACASGIEDGALPEDPRLEAMRQCLAALGPPAHDLIVRRYQLGQSLAAIAADLDRSIGALKKAFFQLRQKLLACVTARLRQDVP